MPYKHNRLKAKREAVSKKRSELGKYGNAVKRQKMLEQASEMRVSGTIRTDGIFGEHVIECLSCDDPKHLWMRVDGEIRRPRTPNGVLSALKDWIFNRSGKKRND